MNIIESASKQTNEDKTAMDLSADVIENIRNDSAEIHPEIQDAKDDYISQAEGLVPSTDSEKLDELWAEYSKRVRNLPRTVNEEFMDFDTWYQLNRDQLISWYNEHNSTPRNQNPFQTLIEKQEEPIDPETYLREKIAPAMYQRAAALDKFRKLGAPSDEGNPLLSFKKFMDSYSRGVANHFKEQMNDIPPSENKTVTFIIGHPGAGKSSIIENEESDKSNPIRQTKFGTLIDPDEFQPFMPGYGAGTRSSDVLIYAKQLVAKEMQNQAYLQGLDMAIPLVGGQSFSNKGIKRWALADEIATALLNGYNVTVILKSTNRDESQQRSLKRAKLGGRLIAPNTSETNPEQAFSDLQSNPQMIVNSVKNQNKNISDQEIQEMLMKVKFIQADENSRLSKYNLAKKIIRIANKLNNKNYYKLSDNLIKIIYKMVDQK
jgi:hypothetical protein